MSTGADCLIVEEEPGKWFYYLQRYPYGATEEYDGYGPFKSLEKAERHLEANHANPGGYCVERYQEPRRADSEDV